MDEELDGECLNMLRGHMNLTSINERNGQTKADAFLHNELIVLRIGGTDKFSYSWVGMDVVF